MGVVWRILQSGWRGLGALGLLIGILYIPSDIANLPQALGIPRNAIDGLRMTFDRESLLTWFAAALVLWIIWMDARPFLWPRFLKFVGKDAATWRKAAGARAASHNLSPDKALGRDIREECQRCLDRLQPLHRLAENGKEQLRAYHEALNAARAMLERQIHKLERNGVPSATKLRAVIFAQTHRSVNDLREIAEEMEQGGAEAAEAYAAVWQGAAVNITQKDINA